MTEKHYQEQLLEKTVQLTALLEKYSSKPLDVYDSPAFGHRMRAEFRIWHDGPLSYHIMFDKDTKQQYRVDQLPAACALINDAMAQTIELVHSHETLRKKLYQIDYLATTTNEIVISLIYHKPLNEDWEMHAKRLRSQIPLASQVNVIGRSKKQKITVGNDFVTEHVKVKGKCYLIKQIENSFTQPNAVINQKMIEWVIDSLPANNQQDLLELYCGAGNFTLPLCSIFNNVLATEISKTSVAAAQDNIKSNGISNLKIARLSSEEFTEAYKQTREFFRLRSISLRDYNFNTVLVDPPRAGLDDETIKLIKNFDTIVYISCNPLTLTRNLAELCKTHSVKNAALFDQFPFTEHIESGVVLTRQ